MAKLGISTGTTPNDGTGDSLLDGAVKLIQILMKFIVR